jgi:hypothetical protein
MDLKPVTLKVENGILNICGWIKPLSFEQPTICVIRKINKILELQINVLFL